MNIRLLLLLLAISTASSSGDGLRRRILQGLGLSSVPDVSKMNVSRHEYERMYAQYLARVDENRRKHEAPLGRLQLLTYNHSGPVHVSERRRTRLHLEVSEAAAVAVTHASLHVFVEAEDDEDEAGVGVEVRVFQLAPSRSGRTGPRRVLLDRKRVLGSRWTELDLTAAASAWLHGAAPSMGVELEHQGGSVAVADAAAPALHVLAEVFPDRRKRDLFVDEKTHYRKVKCGREKPRCCRHEMQVVFKEIGYEFIRQPQTFDLGYCKGRCPQFFNPNTNHAFFQSLLWYKKKDVNRDIPRPCCAPKTLVPLEILHVDEKNPQKLKTTVWQDMKVTECACA